MDHVEQRDFTLRIELRCAFPPDYEGDEDGYEWADGFRPIAAQIVQAAVAAVRQHPRWNVHPKNRGRPSEDEVTLVVERVIARGTDPSP